MRRPSLVPPRAVTPRLLNAALAAVGAAASQLVVRPAAVQAALAYLAECRAAGQVSAVRSKRQIRGLIALYPGLEGDASRLCIEALESAAERLPWQRVWPMWLLDDQNRHRFVRWMAPGLRNAQAASPQTLPGWIQPHELEQALGSAEQHLVAWCEAELVPPQDFTTRTRCDWSYGIGHEALRTLIIEGSNSWLRTTANSETRAWAVGTQHHGLVCAVAERQLTTLGQGKRAAGELVYDAEFRDLKTWLTTHLGDPERGPRWRYLSERSREVGGWMFIREALESILEEFGQRARTDRARFWQRNVHLVNDARFEQRHDSSVCLLLVGNRLFVEFGENAFACYVYQARDGLPTLRHADLGSYRTARQFQLGSALLLEDVGHPFVGRLTHQGSWERRFSSQVRTGARKRSPERARRRQQSGPAPQSGEPPDGSSSVRVESRALAHEARPEAMLNVLRRRSDGLSATSIAQLFEVCTGTALTMLKDAARRHQVHQRGDLFFALPPLVVSRRRAAPTSAAGVNGPDTVVTTAIEPPAGCSPDDVWQQLKTGSGPFHVKNIARDLNVTEEQAREAVAALADLGWVHEAVGLVTRIHSQAGHERVESPPKPEPPSSAPRAAAVPSPEALEQPPDPARRVRVVPHLMDAKTDAIRTRLERASGPMSAGALAKRLHLGLEEVASRIWLLERRGLVERVSDSPARYAPAAGDDGEETES